MDAARPLLRWRFASATFDEASLVLSVDGHPVELERRPLRLLALLLEHAGEIVTKDEIMDTLWPDREVSEASLTNCMTRLRQGLGELGRTAIRTVHGYGYRFAAPVHAEATAPAPLAAPPPPPMAPGDAVPHRANWILVERLGTGGFGDAWLAEHGKTHERRVFKFAADAAGLAALRREVALGRLLREGLGERADLIRILDWHFADLPAFLELVWVEHGNLADWAQGKGGVRAIPLETRLELAAQIAEALAAIHGMGVLHKDLKPANVLIREDAAGRPGIILTDFGSGRLLDPARLDAFGITRPDPDMTVPESSGSTQMYRAPELGTGASPTARADIYALGVLLFQLAAGDLKRALAPGWEEAVEDALLRADIAAAAAGDPERRLGDAGALAGRLRALPERRAAAARAAADRAEAERIRRALELARARRAPLLELVGVLVVALIGSSLLYLRAERAQRAAEAAQGRAETETARARAVTAFLTDDVFSAANPLLAADPNIPVRKVLDAAAADVERRFPKDSLDLAALQAAIGGAYAGLTDAAHAQKLLRAALATRAARLGETDPQTQAVRLDLLDLADRLSDMDGEAEQGRALLDAGPASAETEFRARLAVLQAECGRLGVGNACEARLQPMLEEARRRLGEADPATLRIQAFLAFELSQAQHSDAAIPLARQAVTLTAKTYGPASLLVQERRFLLAEVLEEAGQAAEAVSILEDMRRLLLAQSGGETEFSVRAAAQLGHGYINQHRYDDALAVLHAALDYHLRTQGEMFTATRMGYNDIANALAFAGRAKEAIPMGQKAFDLQRRALGPDAADTLWFENNLADYYHRDGNLAEAETLYRDIVARARTTFPPGQWDLGHFEYHLGEVLGQEGKIAEARAVLSESVALLTKVLGADHARTKRAVAALEALPR
jgi:non-specific serine/threonine protein kinase